MTAIWLLTTLLKVTFILAVGLGGLRMAPRLRAAIRHAVLVGLFGVAVAIPIGGWLMPAFEVNVPYTAEPVSPRVSLATAADTSATRRLTGQRATIEEITDDRLSFTQ